MTEAQRVALIKEAKDAFKHNIDVSLRRHVLFLAIGPEKVVTRADGGRRRNGPVQVFSSFEPVVAKWRAEHPEGSVPGAAEPARPGHPTPAGVVAKTLAPANVVPETSAVTYVGVAVLVALGAYIYLRDPAAVVEA